MAAKDGGGGPGPGSDQDLGHHLNQNPPSTSEETNPKRGNNLLQIAQ